MSTIKRLTLPLIIVVLSLAFGSLINPTFADDPTTKTGLLSITWGDSSDGKSSVIYTLSNAMGERTRLQFSNEVAKGILEYNGKQVTVQGSWAATPSGGAPAAPEAQPQMFEVDVIKLIVSPESSAPTPEGSPGVAGVTGSHPWISIMCKISDIADEPQDFAYFDGMYSDVKPGLDHFWQELSFSTFDIAGSGVAGVGWYTLPHDDAYYNPTASSGGADLTALMTDCIDVADADVDFSLYDGINMMFNFDFDRGWAWGGGTGTLTLDGVTRSWKSTWEPPWAYANISVIAHETGHGFGLPHSTAIDWTSVYDNAWDVMSQDRYNCAIGSVHRDATYGCMAQHTIARYKEILEVIPPAKMMTLIPGTTVTVNLDDLAVPPSTGYQLVKIPIGTSTTDYYTVEARRYTGYDAKLPGEAVIIHKVDDTGRGTLIPNASATDPAVRWEVGETFTDAANGITVAVNATTAAGFEVTISNRPIATPVDTVMVLDRSGSMKWSIPGDNPEGYAARRDALSAGVDRFLADILALSPPADSTLGLSLFSSKALDVPTFASLRTPVNAALATEVADEIGPGAPAHSAAPGCDWMSAPENCEWGSTSIGAALQDGLAKLSSGDVAHMKTLVLFTDGEQNRAPFVTTDGMKICAASSDPAACAAEPEIDADVRIISVGIGDPSSSYHTLLQNLANESQFGTYISANAATPADFPCAGNLTDAFQCVASYTLAGNSPQMVSYANGTLGNSSKTIDTFDVNAGVKMLLLSISFDQAINPSSITDLSSWMVIKKDGSDVTNRFRVVGSRDAKHVLVKAAFTRSLAMHTASFMPQGQYSITLNKPAGVSENLAYRAISFVDDHGLDMTWKVSEPSAPSADKAFIPSMHLAWLNTPLTNATVTARILRPGDDLGDVLAVMPDVDITMKTDKGEHSSIGYRKYLALLKNSEFVQKISPTSGQHPMQYRGSGMYDTSYNPGLISGVYQIRYDVSADVAGYGKVQRVAVQSVYVQPGTIDVDASILSKVIRGNTMTIKLRPKTAYGKYIGPGQMSAFTVSGKGIKLVNFVEDGQDGTYDMVLTGDLSGTISVNYMGKPLFTGQASDFGGQSKPPTDWTWLYYLLLILILIGIIWWLWKMLKK